MQRVGADAIAGTHILQNELPRKHKLRLDYHNFADKLDTPIIVDNGSYECRTGWGSETEPRTCFRSLVGRPKTRREGDPSSYVGRALFGVDWNRLTVRSAFDGAVSYHLDTQETVLDHAFAHLGINTETVNHPVLLTECLCNPATARQQTAELLFETYGVPGAGFGVDSLFSWRRNLGSASDGLVVSSGHNSTTVLALLQGKPVFGTARRLEVGGAHVSESLLSLTHLHSIARRNPGLRSFVAPVQAEELKHRFAYLAPAFQFSAQLSAALGRPVDQRCIIQLPFTPQPVPSEEELAAKTAMRKEQGRRLQELSAKRRMDKLAELQKRLSVLLRLAEGEKGGNAAERRASLQEHGFKSEALLQKELDDVQDRVTNMLQRITGTVHEAPQKPARTFPLLEVDDEDLSPEQLKEKRVQKFLKAAAIGREKAQLRHQEERAGRLAEEARLKNLKLRDPEAWDKELRTELEKLQLKREQRKRAKLEANDRSSASYRKRQRLVNAAADLGADDESFGANDEDWQVYIEMSREDNAEDEDEDARIAELEALLAERNPMSLYQSYEEQAAMFQLDIGSSCVRAPEILYQPSMIGVDQAGLMEVVASVLKQHSSEEQRRLTQRVLLTGGSSLIKGFQERFETELRAALPVELEAHVQLAQNPLLDAWTGAQQWCASEPELVRAGVMLREEYNEGGGRRVKQHPYSNLCAVSAMEPPAE